MPILSRRDFLTRAASAASVSAAALLCPRRAFANPLGLPLGIQLYMISDAMRSDAAAAIRQVAAIGYKEAEPAGFGSLKTASALKRVLDENGLKCPSAHVVYSMNALQKAFDDANALGCTYATASVARMLIPPPGKTNIEALMAPLGKDDLERLAAAMNTVGAQAKKNGLLFASHNHTDMFAKVDGGTGLDFLMAHTDPATVKFELDCGWAAVAGADPAQIVRRHAGRIPMLHIKDFLKIEPGMQAGGPNRPLGAEIGTGAVDYRKIFPRMRGCGVQHIFVEQEGPYTSFTQMQAAQADYKYLHAIS